MPIDPEQLKFVILIAVFALLYLLMARRVKTRSLISHLNPATAYAESLNRIQALRSKDGPELASDAHAIFLTHGQKTKNAVVMYHGYTNCPRQYEKLAHLFFARGYNVYVPRMPYHGNCDLYTKEIGKLSIYDLMNVCDDSVDIAQGLGSRVTVLGLSMGGVMASWAAQFRNDVDTAVVIVPSFSWYFLPGVITPLVNLSLSLPNIYLWWDPVKREKRQAPHSMYYKFSTHGMGHIMRLGLSVLRASKERKPGANHILVMTNAMDFAVDERTTRFLMDQWRRHGTRVNYFTFPKALKMEHDIIDPEHPYEQTDQVYAKIFELLDQELLDEH